MYCVCEALHCVTVCLYRVYDPLPRSGEAQNTLAEALHLLNGKVQHWINRGAKSTTLKLPVCSQLKVDSLIRPEGFTCNRVTEVNTDSEAATLGSADSIWSEGQTVTHSEGNTLTWNQITPRKTKGTLSLYLRKVSSHFLYRSHDLSWSVAPQSRRWQIQK